MKDNKTMKEDAVNVLYKLALTGNSTGPVAEYIGTLERQLVEERQRRCYLEGYADTLFNRVIELESKQ